MLFFNIDFEILTSTYSAYLMLISKMPSLFGFGGSEACKNAYYEVWTFKVFLCPEKPQGTNLEMLPVASRVFKNQ